MKKLRSSLLVGFCIAFANVPSLTYASSSGSFVRSTASKLLLGMLLLIDPHAAKEAPKQKHRLGHAPANQDIHAEPSEKRGLLGITYVSPDHEYRSRYDVDFSVKGDNDFTRDSVSHLDYDNILRGEMFSDSLLYGSHAKRKHRGESMRRLVNIHQRKLQSTHTTDAPTQEPTLFPSASPTQEPTLVPSMLPTALLTGVPTSLPSASPTQEPTLFPSIIPSASLTQEPTLFPSMLPSATPAQVTTSSPSVLPTQTPSLLPKVSPSTTPTLSTTAPTASPTAAPTVAPTLVPSTFYDNSGRNDTILTPKNDGHSGGNSNEQVSKVWKVGGKNDTENIVLLVVYIVGAVAVLVTFETFCVKCRKQPCLTRLCCCPCANIIDYCGASKRCMRNTFCCCCSSSARTKVVYTHATRNIQMTGQTNNQSEQPQK